MKKTKQGHRTEHEGQTLLLEETSTKLTCHLRNGAQERGDHVPGRRKSCAKTLRWEQGGYREIVYIGLVGYGGLRVSMDQRAVEMEGHRKCASRRTCGSMAHQRRW